MATLIFVHGAFATSKSWYGLPSEFAGAHRVIAETLPGHRGGLPLPVGRGRLSSYVAMVAGLISGLVPPGEPVWLIGHSMGGLVISQVAANAADPSQIQGLIYIAGVLPRDGQSTVGAVGPFNPIGALQNHPRRAIWPVMSNQPPLALAGPFRHRPQFDRIAKRYFHCTQDRVIRPALQRRMVAGYPETQVRELASDHLPMHPSLDQPSAYPDLLNGLKEIIDP